MLGLIAFVLGACRAPVWFIAALAIPMTILMQLVDGRTPSLLAFVVSVLMLGFYYLAGRGLRGLKAWIGSIGNVASTPTPERSAAACMQFGNGRHNLARLNLKVSGQNRVGSLSL